MFWKRIKDLIEKDFDDEITHDDKHIPTKR